MEQPTQRTLDIFVRFLFSSDKFVENEEAETGTQAMIPSERLGGWTKRTTLSLLAHSIRKCRSGPLPCRDDDLAAAP